MRLRGIRGATTVQKNDSDEILKATKELLEEIIRWNHIEPEHIASVFITVTGDITATFPARAIRKMEGWQYVPLMCSQEIPVLNSLPKCIRLMIMAYTDLTQIEVNHAYLGEATILRPDLVNPLKNDIE
ncbi:MAG: chorismate mutase [Bacilli bacterium]